MSVRRRMMRGGRLGGGGVEDDYSRIFAPPFGRPRFFMSMWTLGMHTFSAQTWGKVCLTFGWPSSGSGSGSSTRELVSSFEVGSAWDLMCNGMAPTFEISPTRCCGEGCFEGTKMESSWRILSDLIFSSWKTATWESCPNRA